LAQLRPGSVDSVVSSPPYEGNRFDGGEESLKKKQGFSLGYTADGGYGDNTDGQLGNSIGETFWHAARLIVQQCHAILKPGGIAAWVTKDFVRNKARVPFSADWLKLCESCGFELVEWIHASLVKDLGKHADLYGDVHHKTVERKSFFRRLAEKKGSPRIDHEDVIFVRKAAR
jgi:DNA modification methylase